MNQKIDCEYEKKILMEKFISKEYIRDEFAWSENDFEQDETTNEFESKINDEFDKYIELSKMFDDKIFLYNEDNHTVYLNELFKAKEEYCLCLISLLDEVVKKNYRNDIGRFFEDITAVALQIYLGNNSNQKNIDRENNFDFQHFCAHELKEIPHDNCNENFKHLDLHTDLIIWKALDNMPGKIILLVQCKSGKNWANKKPVNIKAWEDYLIKFIIKPIHIYAISDLIDTSEEYIKHYTEKGWIIDRRRILELLADASCDDIKNIRNLIKGEIKNWKHMEDYKGICGI